MALVVKDRVQETSTTTGTGSLTLLGAVTGFQTFSSAIGDTNTTYYTIQNGAEWEVGVGTVSAGALSRDTVLESSNSGSLVNFSAGTKFVFCTYPAERSVSTDAIGVTVQAYDADTTKNDVSNTFTANQVISVTDNTNAALRVTQLGTGNALVVEDATNPDSSPFVVDASGNVGIGTASPTSALVVSGQIQETPTVDGVHLGTASGYASIELCGTSSTGSLIDFTQSGTNTKGRIRYDNPTNAFIFDTNSTERLRIDSSGNVGIGTSSPAVKLDVDGGGSFTGNSENIAPSRQGVFIGKDAGNTNNCGIDIVTAATGLGYVDFTTAGTDWKGRIIYDNSINKLLVYTNSIERMAIDSSGNLSFNSGYGSVATAYGCRAWVNYNTVTTTSIRGSGNVSTLTDNGTGDTTITFINAMPDANYAATLGIDNNGTSGMGMINFDVDAAAPTASAIRIQTTNNNATPTAIDSAWNSVAIFR